MLSGRRVCMADDSGNAEESIPVEELTDTQSVTLFKVEDTEQMGIE